MLVLTRKKNESIKINDDVEVKIISIDGDQVKLGIEAPRHIDIHRKEIFDAIQTENKAAALTSVEMLRKLTDYNSSEK
ncbi:carbon storage regulator CsrA [Alteribacter aurantiacus]|uniref:carbon storage regulator CsrA n=1 Tax=Alteribacter aurantiacus TaxID=254410 RepID=UPI0003FC1C49|nr:carbon storage regulator CsrA [Alteribacter aurantiacus]